MRTTLTVAVALAASLIMASCRSTPKVKEAGFSGEDIMDKIEILRDKFTKSATLNVIEDTDWAVYAGLNDSSINLGEPLAEGRADGTHPLEVANDVRSYFQVVTPAGAAIMAERHLPMTGGYNFRDLGGYGTQDGRYVKWGKFIRSDELHNLTEEDLGYLASVPLLSVVDFRTEEEISAAPDKYPSTVEGVYAYSVNPGSIMDALSSSAPTTQQAVSIMEELNRQLVTLPEITSQYRKFFELLQDEEKVPLLFHCSAGKDRTGMGAALILSALGVDEQTIIKDYLLSNVYLGDKYASYIEKQPELKPLMEVQPNFIAAGLDEIKQRYGSVENYLTGTLGVDLEAFREKYLY